MTKKEIVNRNIGLTFDFVREIIKNPSLAEQLPDNCEIEFIEKDFPITNETTLNNKYLFKVKNIFEPINKIADPHEELEERK